ncbi:MAG: hypothetical protein PHS09_04090 [Candidatus Omnitrophica bacterium]|nr:hypothetical protein [Candidatus Omnitrophota bacterium]
MGVTYKLKQEIIDFILEQKKQNPALGCRPLAELAFNKFQVEVSKSSINALIKKAGLSMPVGRRIKRSKPASGALSITPIKAVIKSAADSVRELSPSKETFKPEKEIFQPQETIPLPPPQPLAEPLSEKSPEPEEKEIEPEKIEPVVPEIESLEAAAEAEEPPTEKSPEKEETPAKEETTPPVEEKEGAVEPLAEVSSQPPIEEEKPLAEASPVQEEPVQAEEKEQVPEPESLPAAGEIPLVEPQPEAVKEQEVPEPEKKEEPKEEIIEPAGEAQNIPEPPKEPEPEEAPPQTPPAEEAPITQTEAPQEVTEENILPAAPEITPEPASPEPAPAPEPEPEPVPVHVEPAAREIISGQGEFTTSGAIILKAADYLLGVVENFTAAVKNRLGLQGADLANRIEFLLYAPYFGISLDKIKQEFAADSQILPLVNRELNASETENLLFKLVDTPTLNSDITNIMNQAFQEVRSVQVRLSDGNVFYLDAQMYSVWSAPQIPYDFCSSIYNVKKRLNLSGKESEPLILFTSPGYDTPSKELFDLINAFNAKESAVNNLAFLSGKFEELESVSFSEPKRQFFAFSLWPWQFGHFRKIKLTGEFQKILIAPFDQEVFVSESVVELLQPQTKQKVTLRGCAIKNSLQEKIKTIILTNLPNEMNTQEVVSLFQEFWPNPQEIFEDYSRKIEIFTYTANYQNDFAGILGQKPQNFHDLRGLFNYYLKALDLYSRRYLFPYGYDQKEFTFVKEHFYDLKISLSLEKGYLKAVFRPPEGYPCLNDLISVCQRLNERRVVFGGNRVWFLVA